MENLDHVEAAKRAIDLMVEQMLDKNLTYPEGVFSDALGNRGYDSHLSISAVRRLLPVLEDETYAESVRLDAVAFVHELGERSWLPEPQSNGESTSKLVRRLKGQEHVFEPVLLNLYETATPRLSQAAGFALIEMRSKLGAEILADVIESGRYDHWDWAIRMTAMRSPTRKGLAACSWLGSPRRLRPTASRR